MFVNECDGGGGGGNVSVNSFIAFNSLGDGGAGSESK